MDKQTGKLIARIDENLPDMDSDLMQNRIGNPKGLQKALKGALCPPEEKTTPPTFKRFRTLKLALASRTPTASAMP